MHVNSHWIPGRSMVATHAMQRVKAMTGDELTIAARRLGLSDSLPRPSLEKLVAARIGLAGAIPRVQG